MTFTLYNVAVSESDQAWAYAVSLDRNTSLEETLKYSAYVAMFFLIFVLIDTRRRLIILAYTIFSVGFVESVFGIYAMFTDLYVIPRETMDGHRWVIGTFVNRNHYAAHIVMTIGIGLGLLYSKLSSSRPWANVRSIFLNIADILLGATGWIVICLIILFSALFLSQSRGGVISFIGALFLVTIVTFNVRVWKDRGFKFIITTGLIVVLSVAWLGFGDLAKRFQEFGNDERWEQWRLTAYVIKDYPTFGVGSGNYRWVFPNYREGTLRQLTYDHAHQDYMELLSEQGLVGMLILGIAFLLLFKMLLKSYRTQKTPLIRGMIFGSLISMAAFMIHGLVDFNFRVPANAAYFYVIAALGLVSTTLTKRIENKHRYESNK
jgi:O-antigen ligase